MKPLRVLLSAGLLTSGLAVMSGVLGASVADAAGNRSCSLPHLTVKVGTAQGAAGTIFYPIVFTNTGTTCVLSGVPRVQPVLGGVVRSNRSVGPAARNLSMGQMPVRHVIAQGHSVSVAFGVTETGNYSARTCRAKNAGAVVVSLAPFVSPTYVALKISVCTKIASTTTRLLTPGISGA
ncbi:MAG: DUF4232 domain-containing protein [Acidimicrobiaceae bacterium]|nr:DUF4232 domain-containing protein [Acidimicrobiaceae bacterium]